MTAQQVINGCSCLELQSPVGFRFEEIIDVSVPRPCTLQIHVNNRYQYFILYSNRVGSSLSLSSLLSKTITVVIYLGINFTKITFEYYAKSISFKSVINKVRISWNV